MTWTLNKQWGEARCIYALLTILAMEFFYVTVLLHIWCDSNHNSCCWLSFPRQGGGGPVETDQVQHHWKGASSKNLFLSSAIHLEWVLLNSSSNETTFFTWTILYKFDFHCFEFDTLQVEILEVECIMADFFEAGITNMVREGETCLILTNFMIQQHIFSLSLIICNCRRDPEGLLWWKPKGDDLCSGQEQLILSAISDGMGMF